jgi:hypothetical protein
MEREREREERINRRVLQKCTTKLVLFQCYSVSSGKREWTSLKMDCNYYHSKMGKSHGDESYTH